MNWSPSWAVRPGRRVNLAGQVEGEALPPPDLGDDLLARLRPQAALVTGRGVLDGEVAKGSRSCAKVYRDGNQVVDGLAAA